MSPLIREELSTIAFRGADIILKHSKGGPYSVTYDIFCNAVYEVRAAAKHIVRPKHTY
jgi:hypothetical protein